MKETALSLAAGAQGPIEKTNILREYIQAYALRSLHESKAFESLSFVGGTALRFLYQLPRFSEDLDFSLESPAGYDPKKWLSKVKRDFELGGFSVDVSFNDRKTVHTSWIKVGKLLLEAGIVALPDQKLSIKLEIDTSPPAGAIMEIKLVNRHLLFALRHHDLPSLMAGKIRALLTRPFAKGRDWYDLLWYMSRVPPVCPNESLLINALAQPADVNWYRANTGWKRSIAERIPLLDFSEIRSDVEAFLERRQEADLLTAEHFSALLR